MPRNKKGGKAQSQGQPKKPQVQVPEKKKKAPAPQGPVGGTEQGTREAAKPKQPAKRALDVDEYDEAFEQEEVRPMEKKLRDQNGSPRKAPREYDFQGATTAQVADLCEAVASDPNFASRVSKDMGLKGLRSRKECVEQIIRDEGLEGALLYAEMSKRQNGRYGGAKATESGKLHDTSVVQAIEESVISGVRTVVREGGFGLDPAEFERDKVSRKEKDLIAPEGWKAEGEVWSKLEEKAEPGTRLQAWDLVGEMVKKEHPDAKYYQEDELKSIYMVKGVVGSAKKALEAIKSDKGLQGIISGRVGVEARDMLKEVSHHLQTVNNRLEFLDFHCTMERIYMDMAIQQGGGKQGFEMKEAMRDSCRKPKVMSVAGAKEVEKVEKKRKEQEKKEGAVKAAKSTGGAKGNAQKGGKKSKYCYACRDDKGVFDYSHMAYNCPHKNKNQGWYARRDDEGRNTYGGGGWRREGQGYQRDQRSGFYSRDGDQRRDRGHGFPRDNKRY